MAPSYPASKSRLLKRRTAGRDLSSPNETANHVLASLPVGPYMLEAALPGFRSYVQTGIVLQVDASPTINVVLQVGQNSEQVEVAADAAQVETRTTAIGQVVTNQQVAEMPLNGRDPHELIFLAGMANYPGAVREFRTELPHRGGFGRRRQRRRGGLSAGRLDLAGSL